ncbi:MAG TPA: lysylphosphatidylglycerol synthase domain-containing protein [Actinomycetota bacterium]|nr:lysylphosphatidylglycerol synthase domain-containing protein [Actinomycetota bacterium]
MARGAGPSDRLGGEPAGERRSTAAPQAALGRRRHGRPVPREIIELVRGRWLALTATTILSHLALWLVLLLALRHVGVSESEISTVQVLGVFAFGRLISALPVTPGGVGVVELTYIGGLVLAGRAHADVPLDAFRAQVAAAVLVFRALTLRRP